MRPNKSINVFIHVRKIGCCRFVCPCKEITWLEGELPLKLHEIFLKLSGTLVQQEDYFFNHLHLLLNLTQSGIFQGPVL
jgi:hypothetical protein